MALVLATVVYLLEVLFFSRRRKPGVKGETDPRLTTLLQELEELKARVEALELRPPSDSALDTQKTLHMEAVRMARNGSSAQELAERLGISRTEADLIIALHKAEP
jgi:hypothetical protein